MRSELAIILFEVRQGLVGFNTTTVADPDFEEMRYPVPRDVKYKPPCLGNHLFIYDCFYKTEGYMNSYSPQWMSYCYQ